MENVINEQTQPTSQPATAEKTMGETAGEVSLGKFKDVNALLSAYNSLQSEFTKRCQRIKELETASAVVDMETSPTTNQTKCDNLKADITQEEKEKILKEYLQGVLNKKQTAVLLDGAGIGVKTPITKPKTIVQAGELAREIFNK